MSATNRAKQLKGVKTKSVTHHSLEARSFFLELRSASLKFWSFAIGQINLTF
jgi:hypothetical protein